MKIQNFTVALALVAATAFATPAFAVTSGSVFQDVQSAVSGSGHVGVQVDGNTATLFGFSEKTDSLAAERAALAAPGIDQVINNIDSNNS